MLKDFDYKNKMLTNNFLKYSKNNYLNIGKYSFLLGVFLLPTAFAISGLFLLFSLFLSFTKIKFSFLKEKINLSIFLVIGLIIFTSLINNLTTIPTLLQDLESYYIWLNLFNWIPALLGFIGFQSYVKSKEDRLLLSKCLLSGTVPVIASCLFHLFFDYQGPFEVLDGLIVWFHKPIEITGGVSGLFSNRNYAGFWLSVNLPFAFYFLKENLRCKIKILPILLISFLMMYLIIYTNSKNALLGMISTFIVFLGIKFILISSAIIILILIFTFLPIININISEYLPEVFLRIRGLNFFINTPRIVLFRSAINYILQRPFLGWGSGTFALIFLAKENMWNPPFVFYKFQHTHNLFLEMAFNFGIPISITLTSIALFVFFRALKVLLTNESKDDFYLLDKAWIASGIVVFLVHLSDLPFYDGRVSMFICILFSALRSISLRKNSLKITN